jgi:GT2 family glycosyltransferase
MRLGSFFSKTSKSDKRLSEEIEILHNSPLLDPVWYRQTYSDLRDTPVNVARHYLEHGAQEGRDPGPLFDTKFYLEQNPDVAASGMNPLVHYILCGAKEGRDPRPRSRPIRRDESGSNALSLAAAERQRLKEHSVRSPATVASIPDPQPHKFSEDTGSFLHPSPEEATILTSKDGDASFQMMPIFQWRKRIEQSGFFDAEWYIRKNKDIARAGINPLDHFIQFGGAELRSPGPGFDARWYVAEYPEVLSTHLDPLAHYLTIGQQLGFQASGSPYKIWCKKFDTLTDEDRSDIRDNISSSAFSALEIIVYFQCGDQDFFEASVKSLSTQLFGEWRALLIFERGYDPHKIERARRAIEGDSRLFIISEKFTSDNLPQTAVDGCFVFIAGGVLIREHALYMFARAAASADCRVVYSDEDTLDENGDRTQPIFKPQYSPELGRQTNYFGPLLLLRGLGDTPAHIAQKMQAGVLTIGGLVDQVLRRSEVRSVLHIPSVLYHDMLAPRPKNITPVELISPEDLLPNFTIIIPTKDRFELIKACIDSIEERSAYPRTKIEIIIVDNGSTDERTLSYLALLSSEGKARIIRDASKFNFSRLNNLAAAAATHEVLLFVNNDIIVDDPLWLRRIATYAVQDDVGAVGGKLLYPDRTIQHGGVILGIQGVAGHDLVGFEENDETARMDATREMCAVTGACLAIRRKVFDEIGGFDTTLAVAFNDVLLCLAARRAGYRNIYINQPLLIHFESKSRGYDDKPEKIALFQREARYARGLYNDVFSDDPYYNPNLCLQQPNELAFPPRRSKPWRIQQRNLAKLKILILSSTAEIGHGVAVVVNLQARHLAAAGYEVYVGGPKGKTEFDFFGCTRIYLEGPAEAAAFAVERGIDCVVVETPPFFSIVRWLGAWPRTLFLDHGEPPAELFLDADDRRAVMAEKRLCFAMASKVFTISAAVRAEGGEERAQIIPNGNSHLAVWKNCLQRQREAVRNRLGWNDKVVLLNVCRFRAGERCYKGLDKYAEVLQEFQFARPKLAAKTIFVLCGKATPEDVAEMQKVGFEVFENVTDVEMGEIYTAADVYTNFSRWEGYNLGIGQALALGLPVVASDIPAHRAFPIFTSNDTLTIIEKLSEFVEAVIDNQFSGERKPIVSGWKDSLAKLEREIVQLCQHTEMSGEPKH